MYSKGTKGIVFGLVLLTVLGGVLAGFCNVEYACKKKCEKTFPILALFGVQWTYTTNCDDQCSKKACCTGYTGPNCTERTEECQQKGKCSGHKCVEQYTEGCMCNKEEKMSEKFMGKDTRTVQVQCDLPCERTSCCSGYTGKDCNEEVKNSFLSATELESVKNQLKIDEGYKEEIYVDSEGYNTFGIGHLIRKTDEEYGKPVGTKVSTKRVHEAFKADVHIASGDVTSVFPKASSFPGEVKEILVNMIFNLGRTRLKKFKKFIAAVNSGDWKTAAKEMKDSQWYGQVGNRAVRLVNRMEAVTTTIGEESNDEGDDSGCVDLSGTCQEDSLSCSGEYKSSLCSGHATRRCCIPSGDDSGCVDLSGTCQEDSLSCSGEYKSSLCSGHATRRCCIPSGDDSGCVDLSGTCQEDSLSCSGEYKSSLCSGHATRRCCIPSTDDSPCLCLAGTCQSDFISCAGGYVGGKCSGASNRRCCLPQAGDTNCVVNYGGVCQSDSLPCPGGYQSNLCADNANRGCCLPTAGTCANAVIKSRSDWSARTANSTEAISTPVSKFFVHHTAGPACSDFSLCSAKVRGIQNYHMVTKGWHDIAYSFLVGGDGNIYEGRGWNNRGAHTQGHNSKSFAVSFIGNFMSQLPTAAALQAAKDLIACGVAQGKISPTYKLFGHRDAGTTSCPGDDLYANVQGWPHYSHCVP